MCSVESSKMKRLKFISETTYSWSNGETYAECIANLRKETSEWKYRVTRMFILDDFLPTELYMDGMGTTHWKRVLPTFDENDKKNFVWQCQEETRKCGMPVVIEDTRRAAVRKASPKIIGAVDGFAKGQPHTGLQNPLRCPFAEDHKLIEEIVWSNPYDRSVWTSRQKL